MELQQITSTSVFNELMTSMYGAMYGFKTMERNLIGIYLLAFKKGKKCANENYEILTAFTAGRLISYLCDCFDQNKKTCKVIK